MPWFEVQIGYENSCGGNWDKYLTKARSKEHAKEKVLAIRTKKLYGDRVEVYLKDKSEMYENGVFYTGNDYWDQ